MDLVAKRKMIVGNWKMHKTITETAHFIRELSSYCRHTTKKLLIAVPFTSLAVAKESAQKSDIVIGAQNINEHISGAYTGEVSARMVKEAGAEFVILGHSERRQYFHETDTQINLKIKRSLVEDLQPLLCIGEHLEQRERGQTEFILSEQIKSSLEGLSPKEVSGIMLAYEPVWAIGSGLPATLEVISSVHQYCRNEISKLFGSDAAEKVSILYGGSVNPANAAELLQSIEVDGVLVGSAALSVDSFIKIVY